MTYTYETGRPLPDGKVAWRILASPGWQLITEDEAKRRHAVVRETQNARMLEASEVKRPAGYPVKWPAKHRPALDEIRALCAADLSLRWTFYSKGGDGEDRPKGSFALDYDDSREPIVFLTVDDLAAHLGTGKTPAARSTKTGKAELVAFIRKATPFIFNMELNAEAAALLEAA